MLNLHLNRNKDRPLQILCIGAHCDDIEIGCGGTILRLVRDLKDVSVFWVVLSSDEARAQEARNSASEFLLGCRQTTVEVKEFQNGFFPYCGAVVKDYFEELKGKFEPDLIFTHYRHDLHQDHRVASELTWNTFRNHFIMEYEIPKYDGDMGCPNFFASLDGDDCKKKIEIIMRFFKSQAEKHWFSEDVFLSLMRIRGMECNSERGFAEGFYCRKASVLF
jgi:LmbE family N-acetylglucosaminyl deacetylase